MTADAKRKRIGEILIENGALTLEKLEKALAVQKKEGGLIGEVLMRLGFVKEEDVVIALATQFGYPYLPLQSFKINPFAIKSVSAQIALKHCLIPVDKVHELLTVAMADPTNDVAKDEVARTSGCRVQAFVSTVTEIRNAIQKQYHISPLGEEKPEKKISDVSFKKATEKQEESGN